LICSGKCDTAVDVEKNLKEYNDIDVSAQTVRNVLKKNGLKAVVKKKKPLLTKRHRTRRMEFANKYKNWTAREWRRVIFSDETKINRFGSDGRKWRWKARGGALRDNQVTPTVKYGGGSLMVWGCISSRGVGNLARINVRMDADLYCRILDENLLSSIQSYGQDRRQIIFQQDRDPKHEAKKTLKWLNTAGIEVLDWPPQSPDLNPIEHVWGFLKRRLSDYPTIAASVDELWERAEEVWAEVSREKCVELIESMPRRIAEVIKAKGGYTDY
jgi:hypothetical protein